MLCKARPALAAWGRELKFRRLFRWRSAFGRPVDYHIRMLVDPTDYDVDPETEERHPRILGFHVVNRTGRGAEFRAQSHGNPLNLPHYVVGQRDYFFPVLRRVTTRNFEWHFTPEHRAVMPGSVSDPALLTSGGSITAGQSSNTTAAFTPTANALMGASWTTGADATVTHTYSNTHTGSGAWDAKTVLLGTRRLSQAVSQVGSAPGSGTVTNTYNVSQTQKAWAIWEVTGHDTTTPVSESNTGSGTATTLAVAVADFASGNKVVSSCASTSEADGITPGADETELVEVASSGGREEVLQVQYGDTATHNWSSLATTNNRGITVEYAQAASGAAPTSLMTLMGVG